MEIKISTEKLQNALARVSKGATNNKILGITSIVTLKTAGKDLVLRTTDGNVVLQETIKDVIDNDAMFVAATPVTLFTALVNKTTTETITLDVTDNAIKYIGNGVNSLPLQLDEEGNVVEIEAQALPNLLMSEKINSKDIDIIAQNNVLGVSNDQDGDYMKYYYLHNGKAITFNRRTLCISNIGYKGEAMISSYLLSLLGLMSGEITFIRSDDGVSYNFINGNTIIFGNFNNCKYAAEEKLLELNASTEFDSEFVVKKDNVKDTLDRISLFADDGNDFIPIKWISKEDGLQIESLKQNAYELIKYSKEGLEQKQVLDKILDLKTISPVINACDNDVKIIYGIAQGLKVVNATSEFIVCYINER